jgi:hypothetical protein
MEDEDESDNVLRNEKLGFNSKSNLLYIILLFISPRHPAILLYCSPVILNTTFSTHLKTIKRLIKAGAKRERV